MWPPGAPVLLLGALAVSFGVSEGSSSHSLRYFYTGVSEPGQGLPRFITVGYVDDQLFSQYDSETRKEQPRAPWMKKVEEEDPEYWERETQISRGAEEAFRGNVETARKYYNQSKGFHTLQYMYGCELRPDGSKGGYDQFAYDGKDYITFDKETKTWTAADSKAQITKRKWEATPVIAQRDKAYLEEECIEWLQRYLDYGNESLRRTEPPVVKVTRKEGYDGSETLTCQAYGFYPKEIETTWRKGGEVLEQLTFRRNVAPYPDGTYHAWLSIEIDPKERDQYQCHVGHDGLEEPLVLVWEEPESSFSEEKDYKLSSRLDVAFPARGILELIIGGVVLLLVLLTVAAIGCWIHKRNKKPQDGYKLTIENNLTI